MSSKFVTFKINEKLFGIDVLSVREINRQMDATHVPQANPFVHGLINLRGQIVTLLDLRYRLGMGRTVANENSHNIVLKVDREGNNDTDRVGILVDEIGDIITAEDIEEESLPANLEEADSHYLSKVVKLENTIVGILSVDKLLATENHNSAA